MPTLTFGEYRPDINALDGTAVAAINNVIPRADGYGPFGSLEALLDELPAACRGYFYARNTDGTVTVFAGTIDELYRLDNTTLTWVLESKGGGPYTDLPDNAHWKFAQFNSYVIAVQRNTAPQFWLLGTSTDFADLAGSPPAAGNVSVVNRFVVLSDLTNNPNRVQWSGLNAVTTWTAGTNSSDYQDLPDGGDALAVVGGEFGLILQQTVIRRMTFSPGSETIFDIQRVAEDVGLMAQHSVAVAGDRVFFLSAKGFQEIQGTAGLLPIGEEMVNRTFLADWDADEPRFMIGAANPKKNIVLFAYKSNDNSEMSFDKALVYHYLLKRWSPIAISGQYLTNLAAPGLTLEALDAIAPGAATISNAANNGSGLIRLTVSSSSGWTTGDWKTISGVTGTTEANGTWQITVVNGTTIDLQGSTFANAYVSGGLVAGSLDDIEGSLDAILGSSLAELSAANTSGGIGFFSGPALEATLETAEQSGDGRRLLVRGFTPITDAAEVYGRLGVRENLNATKTYTDEVAMDTGRGYCALLQSTRYAAGKIRIPAGTNWTFATGVRPDAIPQGMI
jgi:hypothetical protein